MKTFKSKLAGMAFVVGLAAGFANPVFADDSKTLPIAAQMYTLRNSGTLEEQLAILNRAGVSAVETVDMQITVFNGSYLVATPSAASINITDNNDAPHVSMISMSSTTSEPADNGTLRFRLEGSRAGPTTVRRSRRR